MATLLRNSFELLWTPNADEMQGDPRGLLRADNLWLEEDGNISLIRGSKIVSSGAAPAVVTQIFSKTMDLYALNAYDPAWSGIGAEYAKVRYIVSGTDVYRNWGTTYKSETAYEIGVATGGAAGRQAAFGFGFGHIFISHGSQNRKDDGVNISDVGLPQATVPYAEAIEPPYINLSPTDIAVPFDENYINWEGREFGSVLNKTTTYLEIDGHPDTLRAIASIGVNNPYGMNMMDFKSQGIGTEEDIFSISVRIPDSKFIVKVSVTFYLFDTAAPGLIVDSPDYYQFDFTPEGTLFPVGINVWTTLECRRREFTRYGTGHIDTVAEPNIPLDWRHVRGIKIAFTTTQLTGDSFVFQKLKFVGSTGGPLDGQYTYVQVDVQNNGFYLEKSRGSAATPIVHVKKSKISIDPSQVSTGANECWIYRFKSDYGGYYLVKKIVGSAAFDPEPFTDDLSDESVLALGIRLDEFQTNLPTDIIGMECNWKGRNWYITSSALYPSLRNNPSAYDARYVIETANKHIEINYFITRLNADTMVLGTSGDFYEITGTGGILTQDNIDFFDVNIKPLGIKSPPISPSFVVREGNLFYLAADGIRILSGSASTLMIASIDSMFKDMGPRYGIPSTRIKTNIQERYYLGISKNRLFFSTVQFDNNRALYVYDFFEKTWRYENHINANAPYPASVADSIMAFWVEDDDAIIYSTAEFGDKFVRQLDVIDFPAQFQDFKLLTTFDCNQQPRNRKDSYTLKLVLDTNAAVIDVTLRGFVGKGSVNDEAIINIFGTTVATIGKQEVIFSIYGNIGICKYYQLELSGTVQFFKFWNWSVDYEPRPEQLTNLRIPPTTFGIAGRKRIPTLPFVMDTLGNLVSFVPILDTVPQPAINYLNNEKTLCTYSFPNDMVVFNIGGMLSAFEGGCFEFYEMIQPREIELIPDPVIYKHIPYTNFGSSARKRIIQYAIVIDTRDQDVTMIPSVDGIVHASQIIRTNRKQTIIYTFDSFASGIEVACELRITTLGPATKGFELYGINLEECITEKLPPIASHIAINFTNFGTSSRKRFRQFAFTIDSRGQAFDFVPNIDGINYPVNGYITNFKKTVIYTFDTYATGIEIGGTISASNNTDEFEFYGISLEECVYEKLPPLASHLIIPYTNFNTSARKKFRQYSFTIDTFGQNVEFTPLIDGVERRMQVVNTQYKQSVIYTFESEAEGIDIGGKLRGQNDNDFEFYGVNLEEVIYEKLPPRTRYMEVGPTNYGIASRKRIRTIPFVLNSYGQNVKFEPIVDGVKYPAQNFSSTEKATHLYYFSTDNDSGNSNGLTSGIPFGIDYGGVFTSDSDFEFSEMLKPEIVEILPVGKKFDQFGPIEFRRVGKIREVSIRVLHTGTELDFIIYASDNKIMTGKIFTIANQERTYPLSLPKGINPNIFRMELSSNEIFHRFDCGVRVNIDGAQTENKWIPIK